MSSQTSKTFLQQSSILRAETSHTLLRRDSWRVEAETDEMKVENVYVKPTKAIPSSTNYVLLSDFIYILLTPMSYLVSYGDITPNPPITMGCSLKNS